MRKFYILLLICILNIQGLFADNIKQIDNTFSPNCYNYISSIKSNINANEIVSVSLKDSEPIFLQNNNLLPYKSSGKYNSYQLYNSDKFSNFEYLNDSNPSTWILIDTRDTQEIVLDFNNRIPAQQFITTFLYIAKYHHLRYFISENGTDYFEVKKSNISQFSFTHIKIKIEDNIGLQSQWEEIITFTEFSFIISKNKYLLKSLSQDEIKVFSNNSCTQSNFNSKSTTDSFPINANTQFIDISLEENTNFSPNLQKDIDTDWVINSLDNCKNIYNPMQQDTNWNGKWDLCSDDDGDNFIGNKDNCIHKYNPDQKDVNRNNIWDVCEFDIDKDGIFDSEDNCRNIANPNQIDTDKDNIWNSCDNCKLYNPTQKDTNKNGVWDICDQTDKFLEENDDDIDGIINYKDNCRYIANPDQADSDRDSIWNLCDNCKNIQNTYQLDFNVNWVWDMCEDSDGDTIEWYLDNCINISNFDQIDDDNNGIWNVCEDKDYDRILFANDNCPFKYNPDQSDIDRDNIWDVCDEKDNRYIESNKWFFIGLLIMIIALFWVWIYSMLRKLK